MFLMMRVVREHIRIDGIVPGVRGQRAFPQATLPSSDPFLMLDHIGPQRIQRSKVIEGVPHPHRGPFVMNTREEIDQAQADYEAGLFGSVEQLRAHARADRKERWLTEASR